MQPLALIFENWFKAALFTVYSEGQGVFTVHVTESVVVTEHLDSHKI